MKKIIPAVVLISMLLSSCFIFKKKEKYGCPNDASNMTEQQINDRANKHKYRGNTKL